MPTVIVPVGFLMGPEFAVDGVPDRSPLHYEVHLGADPQPLRAAEFAAWAAAFADPAAHADLTIDRKTLEEQLREDRRAAGPVADPGTVVSDLLARGLLLEFDPLDDPLEGVFVRLRLCPQAQGLGSTPESPARYRIGIAGEPLVSVDATVYACWSMGHALPSIWATCRWLARSVGGDTEAIARDVAAAVPHLVSAGVAFLDPAEEA